MYLVVKWINSTRCDRQTARIEREYEDFLIEHFGSAANAFNMKHDFHATHEQPKHPWLIGVIKAQDISTRGLTPTEKNMSKFKISFLDD